MASTLVTPLLIAQPFGFASANPDYINIPIPVPSQISTTVNAASFTDGFPPSTMTPEASGGLPFFGQDMNGILYMISAYCANFAAGALPTYNSTLSSTVSGYPVGCVLVNTAGNGLWVNQVSGNATNPDTGGAGWLPFGGVGETSVVLSSADVTLTALQAALPYVALTGTLTANLNVIFPVNTGQSWIVANGCSGAFTVTVKTASGTGVVVPATGSAAPTSIFCDGVNIQNTGVSTAGLAPINSPALTGTPTAPTASPASTNTTQIATTAFVQAAITAAIAAKANLASPIFSGIPTTPTAAVGTNTLQVASTAFVQAAVTAATVKQKSGTFTSAGGVVSVSFGTTFPSVPRVFVQWNYANPDVGWIVPGSITTTGFQYQSSNAGTCDWFATTA
jgi:hypothetical protein